MADNDVSFCQRAVIEFLVKEEIPAADIHQTSTCVWWWVLVVLDDG